MLDIYGVTDIGCVRKCNEDYIHWQPLKQPGHYLAVLADGMGGYAGGSMASRLAVEYFTKCIMSSFEYSKGDSNDEIAKQLLEAGTLANRAVRQQRSESREYEKMGTTLLVMLILDDECWLMHVGDSRCYRLSQHSLQAMTRDHSLVQELLDKGSITEEEAENAPFKNMLTRAVGPDSSVQYSLAKYSLQHGESWLLCSDGLYNTLPSVRISELLQQNKPAKEVAQALVQESLKQNAQDNVSVIVIQPEYNERRN